LLWRGLTAATGALAAVLVLFIVASFLLKDLELVPYQYAPEYVAVVNRGGDLPALIVRVDTRKGIVNVRALGAEAPPGRSLELWYIAAGKPPKSLGIVENTSDPVAIPAVLREGIVGASIAVTAEPKGGSPTGGPTGPIVYSGKLIEVQR
jgi:anti-sigma-K factor RskA